MMLSPSKKIRWQCPECASPNIDKDVSKGSLLFAVINQSEPVKRNAGLCQSCGVRFAWNTRTKVSIKKEKINMMKVLSGNI